MRLIHGHALKWMGSKGCGLKCRSVVCLFFLGETLQSIRDRGLGCLVLCIVDIVLVDIYLFSAEESFESMQKEHTSRMAVERTKGLKLKMQLENLDKTYKQKVGLQS